VSTPRSAAGRTTSPARCARSGGRTRTPVTVALALWHGARLARGGDWLSATVVVGAASIVLSPVSWTHHQIWLVLAVLLPVPGRARAAWAALVLAVMLLPLPALGPPLWSNSRLLLAVAIATVVPVRTPARPAVAPRQPAPVAAAAAAAVS
jgi:hypothetical protein